MRQEREQIMRKKGVSSEQKTEAGRAKGVGHLFLQKDGELAGRPQQPPAYCGQLIVNKERAMDSPPAAGLIMSTLPQLEPHPKSTGHRHLKDSTESLCLSAPPPLQERN